MHQIPMNLNDCLWLSVQNSIVQYVKLNYRFYHVEWDTENNASNYKCPLPLVTTKQNVLGQAYLGVSQARAAFFIGESERLRFVIIL